MSASPRRPAAIAGIFALGALLSGCSVIGGGASWMGQMHERSGMMGGQGLVSSTPASTDAGTVAAPRIIQIIAGPGDTFSPSNVLVKPGETITFAVTTMGPAVHEFKVGPLDEVKADASGLPEISNIGMMSAGTLTYTFNGSGPFGFACHEPGHFENGMWGTVTIAN